MTAPSAIAYYIVGGVLLVSMLAPLFLGFDEAWFVPVAILPFGAAYALLDRKLREREASGPANQGH
jgi:hypothetical protein